MGTDHFRLDDFTVSHEKACVRLVIFNVNINNECRFIGKMSGTGKLIYWYRNLL